MGKEEIRKLREDALDMMLSPPITNETVITEDDFLEVKDGPYKWISGVSASVDACRSASWWKRLWWGILGLRSLRLRNPFYRRYEDGWDG